MLEKLSKADFEGRVGETFAVAVPPPDGPIELRLAEARALGGDAVPGSGRAPFALVFCGGPPDRYLPQRIYPVEHPAMGRLEIFLVPLGPDRDGMRYEAVFT